MQESYDTVSKKLDEYRNITCIKSKIDKAFEMNANRYIAAKIKEKNGILAGKIDIKDAKDLDKLLSICADDEEREIKLEEYVPFLLETELRKRGGIFQAKANWTTNVVTDERLITGQNPGSAAEDGEAIVKLMETSV